MEAIYRAGFSGRDCGEVGRRIDHPLWEARDTAKPPDQSFLAGVSWRFASIHQLVPREKDEALWIPPARALSPWTLIRWTEGPRLRLRRRAETAQAAGGITRAKSSRGRRGRGEAGVETVLAPAAGRQRPSC
jgi:hypothetical protein